MAPGAVSHRAKDFVTGPEAIGVSRDIFAASEDAKFGMSGPFTEGKRVRGVPGAAAGVPSTARLRVHVEGWCGMPHSFTAVAAGLVVELAARPGVEATWADAPLPPHWAAPRAHALADADEG